MKDLMWSKAEIIAPIYKHVIFNFDGGAPKTRDELRTMVDEYADFGTKFLQKLGEGDPVRSKFIDFKNIIDEDF